MFSHLDFLSRSLGLFREYSALFLSILASIFPSIIQEKEKKKENEKEEEEEEGERRWKRGILSVFICCLIYLPVRMRVPSLGMVKGLVGGREGGGGGEGVLRKVFISSSPSSSSSSGWWKNSQEVAEWGGRVKQNDLLSMCNSLFSWVLSDSGEQKGTEKGRKRIGRGEWLIGEVVVYLKREMGERRRGEEVLDLACLFANLVSLVSSSYSSFSVPSLSSSSSSSSSPLSLAIYMHLHTLVPLAFNFLKSGEDTVAMLALNSCYHLFREGFGGEEEKEGGRIVDTPRGMLGGEQQSQQPQPQPQQQQQQQQHQQQQLLSFLGTFLHHFSNCLSRREGGFPFTILPLFLLSTSLECSPPSPSPSFTPTKQSYSSLDSLLFQSERTTTSSSPSNTSSLSPSFSSSSFPPPPSSSFSLKAHLVVGVEWLVGILGVCSVWFLFLFVCFVSFCFILFDLI